MIRRRKALKVASSMNEWLNPPTIFFFDSISSYEYPRIITTMSIVLKLHTIVSLPHYIYENERSFKNLFQFFRNIHSLKSPDQTKEKRSTLPRSPLYIIAPHLQQNICTYFNLQYLLTSFIIYLIHSHRFFFFGVVACSSFSTTIALQKIIFYGSSARLLV